MTTLRDAAQQALEALEYVNARIGWNNLEAAERWAEKVGKPVEALRAALAQPEQEPVAWINVEERKLEWNGVVKWETPTIAKMDKVPLYKTPY